MTGPVLARAQSDSSPTKSYEIRLGRDHRVYCTCPAWKFSRGIKTCKHLDRYHAALTIDRVALPKAA